MQRHPDNEIANDNPYQPPSYFAEPSEIGPRPPLWLGTIWILFGGILTVLTLQDVATVGLSQFDGGIFTAFLFLFILNGSMIYLGTAYLRAKPVARPLGKVLSLLVGLTCGLGFAANIVFFISSGAMIWLYYAVVAFVGVWFSAYSFTVSRKMTRSAG